jgi:hypothetical protein
MILLSLILLLGIGTMPDLHSSSNDPLNDRAEIAIATLNGALSTNAKKFELSDFNETGIRALSSNSRHKAKAIAFALLEHHTSGWIGGSGYYTALTGNNQSLWGAGERGAYLTVVEQLKQIRDTAPHSTTGDGGSGSAKSHVAPIPTPTPELMATTIPQPAPSHPAAGATSTTTGHTPPLNAAPASGSLPTPSATVPPTHPTPTPATPHTTPTGNTEEATGSRATLPQQPSQPVVQPPLTPPIRTRIPYTKTQKGAMGGGFLTTAAGLAWLFTLLAQKESREDIKLFWGELFSKKTKAAVATRAARIRSEIKRHGNESIGALTTTLAGLGLLLYGGLPRYQKPTHTPAHGAEGTN